MNISDVELVLRRIVHATERIERARLADELLVALHPVLAQGTQSIGIPDPPPPPPPPASGSDA